MKHTKGYRLLALPLVASALPAAAAEGMGLLPHVVNYLIFFGGLAYLLREHIAKFFGKRLSDIKASLAMAEKSREEAKRRLDELEGKMKNLDRELEDIGAIAIKEAEKERNRMQERAREDSEKIMAQAKADVENMRREAVMKLRSHIADLAVAEARKRIEESVDEKERDRLFGEFSSRLEAKS